MNSIPDTGIYEEIRLKQSSEAQLKGGVQRRWNDTGSGGRGGMIQKTVENGGAGTR